MTLYKSETATLVDFLWTSHSSLFQQSKNQDMVANGFVFTLFDLIFDKWSQVLPKESTSDSESQFLGWQRVQILLTWSQICRVTSRSNGCCLSRFKTPFLNLPVLYIPCWLQSSKFNLLILHQGTRRLKFTSYFSSWSDLTFEHRWPLNKL